MESLFLLNPLSLAETYCPMIQRDSKGNPLTNRTQRIKKSRILSICFLSYFLCFYYTCSCFRSPVEIENPVVSVKLVEKKFDLRERPQSVEIHGKIIEYEKYEEKNDFITDAACG